MWERFVDEVFTIEKEIHYRLPFLNTFLLESTDQYLKFYSNHQMSANSLYLFTQVIQKTLFNPKDKIEEGKQNNIVCKILCGN